MLHSGKFTPVLRVHVRKSALSTSANGTQIWNCTWYGYAINDLWTWPSSWGQHVDVPSLRMTHLTFFFPASAILVLFRKPLKWSCKTNFSQMLPTLFMSYTAACQITHACAHTHTQTHTDGWELKGTMQHIQNGIAVEIHTKLYISDNTGVTTARCQSNLSCLYSVNFFSKNTRQDTIHNVSYEDRHTKRKASWQTHAHTFTVWNSDRNTLQNRQTNRQTHTDTYTQG